MERFVAEQICMVISVLCMCRKYVGIQHLRLQTTSRLVIDYPILFDCTHVTSPYSKRLLARLNKPKCLLCFDRTVAISVTFLLGLLRLLKQRHNYCHPHLHPAQLAMK